MWKRSARISRAYYQFERGDIGPTSMGRIHHPGQNKAAQSLDIVHLSEGLTRVNRREGQAPRLHSGVIRFQNVHIKVSFAGLYRRIWCRVRQPNPCLPKSSPNILAERQPLAHCKTPPVSERPVRHHPGKIDLQSASTLGFWGGSKIMV